MGDAGASARLAKRTKRIGIRRLAVSARTSGTITVPSSASTVESRASSKARGSKVTPPDGACPAAGAAAGAAARRKTRRARRRSGHTAEREGNGMKT